MRRLNLLEIITILAATAVALSSCETTSSGGKKNSPDLGWSVSSKSKSKKLLSSDLYLRINGKSHLVAQNVPSLDQAYGPLKEEDVKRLNAVGGYYFDQTYTGKNYFAREEPGAVAVYVESLKGGRKSGNPVKKVKTVPFSP